MDNRAVFLYIIADDCTGCKRVKPFLPQIESSMKATGKVRFKVIEKKRRSDRIDTKKYPADLIKYDRWVPIFMLIDGNTWNKASPEFLGYSPDAKLDVRIFNGKITENNILIDRENFIIPSPENLVNWVENSLKTWNQIQAPVFVKEEPMSEKSTEKTSNTILSGPNAGIRNGYTSTNAYIFMETDICRIRFVPKNH